MPPSWKLGLTGSVIFKNFFFIMCEDSKAQLLIKVLSRNTDEGVEREASALNSSSPLSAWMGSEYNPLVGLKLYAFSTRLSLLIGCDSFLP
jgi:hypothetical protein